MPTNPLPVDIRPVEPGDAAVLSALVDEFASFEHLPRPDDEAKARLWRDVTGDRPRASAFLALVDGQPAGYAIVFETYSSFIARPTLFLEDIFVRDVHRGRRVGYALFRAMAAEADRRGCCRMEWRVLHWNGRAIAFYEQLGAERHEGWHTYRLPREAFARLE